MKTGEYRYDVVEVIWDDAETLETGWDLSPKDLKEALVMTIGFLIKETRKHIVITSTTDGININGGIQIPKKMILSRKIICTKSE